MGIARKILLAASTSTWIRERATKAAFVRRTGGGRLAQEMDVALRDKR